MTTVREEKREDPRRRHPLDLDLDPSRASPVSLSLPPPPSPIPSHHLAAPDRGRPHPQAAARPRPPVRPLRPGGVGAAHQDAGALSAGVRQGGLRPTAGRVRGRPGPGVRVAWRGAADRELCAGAGVGVKREGGEAGESSSSRDTTGVRVLFGSTVYRTIRGGQQGGGVQPHTGASCDEGKGVMRRALDTFSRREKLQSKIFSAFDEVQTIPPCSPQKAFKSAAELM